MTPKQLLELTEIFSPTAALGGRPQNLALAFLEKTLYNQKYPNRTFGSAFGFYSADHAKFIVAIRNIQWNKNDLYIESGAGIVNDSQLPLELEEIGRKRNSILQYYL
jgi:isochorismate synthase EntC